MNRPRKLIASSLAVVVVATLWFLFAPRQIPGGSVSYVVPSGTSMLPTYERGDVVILREASSYRPGDVVAYESDDLRRLVLHRIVRIQGEHFVLKGDANTWLDSDKPTQAEIVGRTWIHLPVGGGILAWLRTPINAAIVAGIFGLLAFGGAANRRSRRNRLRRGRKDAPPRRAPIPEPQAGYGRLAPLGGAAGGAIGAIVILVFALSRPASVERTEEIAYTHTGDFTYSAEASPSQAYEADVKTGDPVFVRLAPVVDVGFEYRLDSQIPAALSGTIGLSAELQDLSLIHI